MWYVQATGWTVGNIDIQSASGAYAACDTNFEGNLLSQGGRESDPALQPFSEVHTAYVFSSRPQIRSRNVLFGTLSTQFDFSERNMLPRVSASSLIHSIQHSHL